MPAYPSAARLIETWLALVDAAHGPPPVVTLADPLALLANPWPFVGAVLAVVLVWFTTRRRPPGGGVAEISRRHNQKTALEPRTYF